MKPVVFILADAFRYDYIEKHDLKNIKKIIEQPKTKISEKLYPSTGYCEIIEYFTGQESHEHGMFSQITAVDNWNKVKSPLLFKFFEPLDYYFSGIRKVRYVWGKITQKILPLFIEKNVANIKYRVPLSILNRFTPTESLFEYDSYEFGGDKNVFVKMKESDITYDLDDFVKHNKISGGDDDRFSRLNDKIINNALSDFTMIYISAPEYAHFYGIDGLETKKKLQDFDENIRVLQNNLKDKYQDYDLFIVGDHGMLDVHESVNIQCVIDDISKEHKFKLGTDFLYFIDSTVCRLWYSSEEIQSIFESKLLQELSSNFELQDEVVSYLEQFKPKYGDSIFLLKANKVYFPDFFNGLPNKGMHGYLNHYEGQQGCVIWDGSEAYELPSKIKLSDVKSLIWSAVNERY